MLSPELAEGYTFGRYTLLTRLAQGGMADVWLARADGSEGFQKTVVIKTILPHLANDEEFVRMFVNEGLMAADLDHPNIVHIHDMGPLQGSYYIAMEYIAGRTLRHILRELQRTQRVPPPWLVLHVAAEVCEALQYARDKTDAAGQPLHLVHRDISPENVMVTFNGETKVLDFGIARTTASVTRTGRGVLKGKHAYMAPEQVEGAIEDGAQVGATADLYSLGVVIYELITGRRPFRAENELALIHQILSASPEPPSSFCPWVPDTLSELVLKAMARNPSQRFASAGDMRTAIEAYLGTAGAAPTRRHVADYMRSLFGDTGPAPTATDEAVRSDVSTGRDCLQEDPWETSVPSSVSGEPSLTIDLSLMLAQEDRAADSIDARRAAPPASARTPVLARLESGWDAPALAPAEPSADGAQQRGPATAELDDELVDFAEWSSPAGSDPMGKEATPRQQGGTPQPAPQANDAESAVPAPKPPARGAQLWEAIARRAKEQDAADSDLPTAGEVTSARRASTAPQVREGVAWDDMVERARRASGKTSTSGSRSAFDRRPLSPHAEAVQLFEQGLGKMRGKDLDGALECWTKASELDPENRTYQTNLRVLIRQIAERDVGR